MPKAPRRVSESGARDSIGLPPDVMLATLRSLILLTLFAAAAGAHAQDLGAPYFESVGDAETIPDNNVTALTEDTQGFLWIGTPNGLIRYDGYRFQRFVRDAADPHSLGGVFIRTLHLARDGRLWIGTDADGVSIFDPGMARFTRLRADPGGASNLVNDNVRAFAEDSSGGIYIGTRAGIDYWNAAKGQLEHLPARLGAATSVLDNRIMALLIDRRGDLWAGSWNGLSRKRAGSDHFERVQSLAGEPLAGQLVLTLFELADGRIALSTTQLGGFLVDPQTQGLQPIAVGLDAGTTAADSTVLAMLQPRPDELWLGGFGGIVVVDPTSTRVVRQLRTDPAVSTSLAHTQVRTFLRDRSGQIWIGGYSGGLQKHDPGNAAVRVLHHSPLRRGTLSHPSVSSLLEVDSGEIWIGTRSNGIDILDRQRGVIDGIRPQPDNPQGLGNGIVLALAQTADRSIWAGTLAGLYRFDPLTREARFFGPDHGLVGTTVRRLLSGRSEVLWIGSNAGLSRWTPQAPELIEAMLTVGGTSIPAEINAIAEQADGRLWVGSTIGLYTLAPGTDRLQAVRTLDGPGAPAVLSIVGLLVDSKDRLWVDSAEGLQRLLELNGRAARFEAISEQLGIGGQPFGANLLEDAQGRIWSQRYLYDPAEDSVYELSRADGIDIGTAWFRSYVETRDGKLLFGGSKGLLIIDPGQFRRWSYDPPVVATALKIDGQALEPSQYQQGFSLAPGRRTFSLEFAALDLSAPERNRYAYQLEGYDAEFIETDASHRVASYSNLRPGNYTLTVRGSGRTGDWSPHELHLPLKVLPQYWQTGWFRALMVALSGALIVIALRTHSARVRRHERELTKMVEQRTHELSQAKEKAETALVQLQGAQKQLVVAEKMASLGQLVAGVAHEINTPLGIALTASSMLSDEAGALRRRQQMGQLSQADMATYLELAERASSLVDNNLARAANLVRSFKQVSVDRSLDERRRFDLGEYLRDLSDSLELTWRNRGVRMQVSCVPGLLLDSYPGTLGQIVGILTQNALLHAFADNRPGLMTLDAEAAGTTEIRLCFADDGSGIAKGDLPRIFEPFFTTRRAQGSTGLGLHIVFNLVSARLGGQIEVFSDDHGGTRFELKFPRVAPA